jgi:hypothetical protein
MGLVAPLGGTLAAQAGTKDTKATPVPEAAMPPAGMCRVWLRDVPERQQPAPTDCSTAIKSMPRDAQVLFGDLKRAATVAAPGSAPTGTAAAALRQGNGSALRDPPSFRGMGGNNGELRSAAQAAASARAAGGRQGIVGVAASAAVSAPATAPAATKAPDAKAVIKPEKPQ